MNDFDKPVLTPTRTDGPSMRRSNLSERVKSLRLAESTNSRPRGAFGGFLPWALCVILGVSTFVFGFKSLRGPGAVSEASPDAVSSPATTAKTVVSTPTSASPQPAVGEVVLEAKGYVIPSHQIQVSPKVAGMIIWLHEKFEEGYRFEKGTVLARLESDDYESDVKRAQAGVAAAERRLAEIEKGWPLERAQAVARLSSSRTVMDYRRRELERLQRSGAGVSRKELDEAESLSEQAIKAYDEALKAVELLSETGPRPSRIAAARAEVESARAELNKAEWRFKQCEIVAPVSGTVLTKKAEKGNLVNPVAFNVSASLCEMADLGDLEVDLSIQERDIAIVSNGQPCIVMPEAFKNNEAFRKLHPEGFRAQVSRLMPIADRAKGAISVRVKIDAGQIAPGEEGRFLKPEMSVLVSFKKAA